MGVVDPPRTTNRRFFLRNGTPQFGQRRVPSRDGSVPVATVRTLMLQIWDFGHLGLQVSDLGLASGSPTVRERRERDSRWSLGYGTSDFSKIFMDGFLRGSRWCADGDVLAS
ncbi:magnesium transporter, putative [Actinidia rufa]|uniref:Magnesium transporter, putative n=1 Tax=Actinidia rufa TaxID=165716 RepID=A0A7J0DJP7_9ERIC|nr:magnesium transporter, putative [Actinidia rufa]